MAYMISRGKIDDSMTRIGFMFGDASMISILGAVMAGVFICGDFDNKTINDAIANGCSSDMQTARCHIYLDNGICGTIKCLCITCPCA